MDRGAYALVGAAAAQIAGHRGVDVGIRRLRGVRQQGRRRHDLTGLTIAALRDVQLDPGLLYRMAAIGRQTLDGGHAPRADRVHRRDARADWLPIQVHGARTAQGHAAAELGAGQAQRVAQHPQQRHVGIDIDFGVLAVDAELDHCTPSTGAPANQRALELARAHRARHRYYTAARERRASLPPLPGEASCEGAADPLQCLAATSDAKASALSQIPTPATPAAPITTEAVIIGAGPCGLFQVFELGLLGIGAHVVDSLRHPGGQCAELYPDKPIYDIPALPVCGAQELVDRLMQQIRPFKPQLHLGHEVVEFARRESGRFHLRTAGGVSFDAGTVVIAAGVGSFQARRIGLEGADTFEGSTIQYRVKSAAELAGKHLVIFGGGDSALDWTLELLPRAASLVLVHRRHEFRAAPASVARMQEQG